MKPAAARRRIFRAPAYLALKSLAQFFFIAGPAIGLRERVAHRLPQMLTIQTQRVLNDGIAVSRIAHLEPAV